MVNSNGIKVFVIFDEETKMFSGIVKKGDHSHVSTADSEYNIFEKVNKAIKYMNDRHPYKPVWSDWKDISQVSDFHFPSDSNNLKIKEAVY